MAEVGACCVAAPAGSRRLHTAWMHWRDRRCRRVSRPHSRRHSQRFILVYITFLPFAFVDLFGWWAIPGMATISFLLAGVENVGVWIEEPHRWVPA